jgi:DNA polymerase-3 subunit gamma/tau
MTQTNETRIETYIPLYRKYRPQVFADMVGQEAIVQTLGNAIRLNKVAHAYLFCGPRGTGKTSTARIFAKSLNCEQGPTVTPCMQCASCTGITQGNALDVIEFDAASNNGVGDARELIENCQYSSMTGRFKVYIIDEVHMLTPQAFNALLKTLEEPPANVIFIFATTEAHKVLPTIISRCQRFDFTRITTENIINRLQFIAQQENIAIDADALLMIARHARGGLRDAVGLLDQVAVLGRAQPDKIIGRKDVAMFIGTLEEDLLLRLGNAIAERRAADLLTELNELLSRGLEPIQLLKDLTLHFRNLLLVQTAGANVDPEMLSLPPEYYEQLATQAKLFPALEEIPQIIGRLSAVERHIRNGTQPQVWLEVGLIELAYRHEIHLVQELSERVARLEAQLSGQAPMPMQTAASSRPPARPAAPVPASRPAAPPAPQQPVSQPTVPSVPPSAAQPPQPLAESPMAAPLPSPQPVIPTMPEPVSAIAERLPLDVPPAGPKSEQKPIHTPSSAGDAGLEAPYAQVCAAIPSLMFRSLVQQQTFPISLDGDVLTIGCVGEPNLTTLKKPDKFIHLQKAVDKVFGRPIRIEVVLEKKRPSLSGGSAPVAAAMPSPAIQPEPMRRPVEEPSIPSSVATVGTTMQAPPLAQEAMAQATVPTIVPTAVAVAEPPPMEAVVPLQVKPSMGMDDAPPLEDDGPPFGMMDDEEDGPSVIAPAAAPILGGDPELSEAKKHAMELLQGRIIDS